MSYIWFNSDQIYQGTPELQLLCLNVYFLLTISYKLTTMRNFFNMNRKGIGDAEFERQHTFHLLSCFCFLDLKTEAQGT